MYATYTYAASSTAANILADVVLLLTGTTDKGTLSANCVQGTTSIDASVTVAGWTVYDASAGTNAQCLRAPVADNASQYKYLVIDTNTAGYILQKVYETWNSGTHAGTNLAYNSDNTTYSQRTLIASGGTLYISANVRHCFIYSLQGGVYGNSSSSNPSGILERSRLSPWDTVANGYPPFVYWGAYSVIYEPRSLNATGGDITGNGSLMTIVFPLGGSAETPPTTSVISNSNKVTLGHVFLPFGACKAANGHLGGDFSSFSDIWLTTYNSGSPLDTVVYGGNTYNIWSAATTWRYAVRQG
jgi:hypothetical protein